MKHSIAFSGAFVSLALGCGGVGATAFAGALPASAATTRQAPPPGGAPASGLSNAPQVSPGQTVRLANYAWVEQELQIPNLPPSWVMYLERLTVAVTDAGPAPDAPAALAGNQVASQSCTGHDIFGITVWTYNSYVGFSTSHGKITNMSTPNDYFNSDYGYLVSQPSWQTSQPGPPTASMTGQDGTNLYLATVPYGAISIEYHFSGNGSYSAYC